MNSQRIRFSLFFSLVDQFSVSGGNFLTVAICAHLLNQTEHGHFLLAYSAYVALLTFNIALFYSAAPAIFAHSKNPLRYTRFLALQSSRFWLASSLTVATIFFLFGSALGWQASISEVLTLASFLFFQQGADFARRLGYLNSENGRVARNSTLLYVLRIASLFAIKPHELDEIFGLLTICSLPWGLLALNAVFREGSLAHNPTCDSATHWSLSKWAIATTPLIWWFGYAPLFYLGAHASSSDVAIVGNLRSLTGAANVLMELLETAIPVLLAKRFVSHGKKHAKEMALTILFAGVVTWALGSAVILLLGQQILSFVFGPTYSAYADLLLLSWFGMLCYFFTRVVQVYFRAQGIMHVDFVGGVVMAMLTLILLPSLARAGIASVLIGFAIFPLVAVFVQAIYIRFFKAAAL